MSFNRSRLSRIEQTARGGPCPECKLKPDGPGYIVLEEGEETSKDPDERCPGCGRFLWFIIRVVYEDRPEEAAEEGEARWP